MLQVHLQPTHTVDMLVEVHSKLQNYAAANTRTHTQRDTHRQAGKQASLVQLGWPPFEAASR